MKHRHNLQGKSSRKWNTLAIILPENLWEVSKIKCFELISRHYLIKELLAEDERYKGISVPSDEQEQKNLLRSLMNVRMPKPISCDFLQVQDEYLQYERDKRGITDGAKLPSIPRDSRLVLWQGDITTLKVDAIVNAANSGMLGCFHPLHSCIDNIVGTRSGIQLLLYCYDIMKKQGHD